MIPYYLLIDMVSKKEYIREALPTIKQMIAEGKPKVAIAKELNVQFGTLDKYLHEFGIHYQSKKRDTSTKTKPLTEYLNGDRNITPSALHKKLVEGGYKEEKCEMCGLTHWFGQPIPLEVHHKNQNHYDNDIDNLAILCPTCHRLTHRLLKYKKKFGYDTYDMLDCLRKGIEIK